MGNTTPCHYHFRITPQIIKNLIFVGQFTRDNTHFIEFNDFVFSIKDYWSHRIPIGCDNERPLFLTDRNIKHSS